jgi:calcineurin-like phosphoesterase family protein
MNWITSDTHFNHANIIDYCSRPFSDIAAMNYALIARWNERVTPEDTVYHLGDFAMGSPVAWPKFTSRLYGHKILVPGNHDRDRGEMLAIGFNQVLDVNVVVNIDGVLAWLNHYPLKDETARKFVRPPAPAEYDIALCGHVHQHWKVKQGVVNVGVDVWDFTPISIRQALDALIEWN